MSKAEIIFNVILAIIMLIAAGAIIASCNSCLQEEKEYSSLPKESWVVEDSSFKMNGKKCSVYLVFNGINLYKWKSYQHVTGRFVRCEGDAAPSNMEIPVKGGWK